MQDSKPELFDRHYVKKKEVLFALFAALVERALPKPETCGSDPVSNIFDWPIDKI